MSKKIILADVDAVVLNWGANLPFFARDKKLDTEVVDVMAVDHKYRHCTEIFKVPGRQSRDLMWEYHLSHYGRTMPAYIDALEVMNRLKDEYDFIAVTAFGSQTQLVENREYNLNTLFPGIFLDVVCVDGSKLDAFYQLNEQFCDRIVAFVDDREDYIMECRRVFGRNRVTTYQLCRGEQEHSDHNHIDRRVRNWYEIESHING